MHPPSCCVRDQGTWLLLIRHVFWEWHVITFLTVLEMVAKPGDSRGVIADRASVYRCSLMPSATDKWIWRKAQAKFFLEDAQTIIVDLLCRWFQFFSFVTWGCSAFGSVSLSLGSHFQLCSSIQIWDMRVYRLLDRNTDVWGLSAWRSGLVEQ